MKSGMATFGAGCFWGVEVAFRNVDGVKDVAVGFMGGNKENPSYEDVCYDETGHAEVAQVTFDPEEVTYEELLETFWMIHNPTMHQRHDQYRSVIFYNSEEQKAAAEKSKKALEESGKYRKPVVTEIVPAGEFYRAEEYHQRYLEKNGFATCKV